MWSENASVNDGSVRRVTTRAMVHGNKTQQQLELENHRERRERPIRRGDKIDLQGDDGLWRCGTMLWVRNGECDVEFQGKKLKNVMEDKVRLCSHIRPSTKGSVMVSSHGGHLLVEPVTSMEGTPLEHPLVGVVGDMEGTHQPSYVQSFQKRRRSLKRAEQRIGESKVDEPSHSTGRLMGGSMEPLSCHSTGRLGK